MNAQRPKLNAERMARLVEISRVLNATTNLDHLLSRIITEAADLTSAEAASILLLDPNTQQLHFKASSNEVPPELADMAVSLDSSIAGAILTQNKPMYIQDVSKDPRWNQNVDDAIAFKTRSILGVPMHNVTQEPVGVLEALNKSGGGDFSIQDFETLSILADIAGVAVEQARLFNELQQANAELNELDQLKTDFIAIASHELRTPLSVILGYVSFLRDEAGPKMTAQFDNVLQAAVHLRTLIQDMLNLRYVDAGTAALTRKKVDLVAMVQEMNLTEDETAVAKNQTVHVTLPEDELLVLIDQDMMEVIIGNLLNNAVKFSPKGSQIKVKVERHGREAWFRIKDNGVGIPEDQLERIFKRFYQVESPLRRQHEGMGLGLSIAKELVELHNGRIWAESSNRDGSEFILALRLELPPTGLL
ncbi:MAG: GAF domain-containing sensor histidine kinase [Anaerolineales bacterium]|nr:GAF domain-containing sensor histidine kinase [Anaerolineales bacterium]MCB8937020.1 GAF domain-containing sensor histidine kinase [Ardenticatenaceae bacterium]